MIGSLLIFVFAGLFSPGPNVVMLTASGARFGFGRTVPHILGVASGVGVVAGLTGLGLGAVLELYPAVTSGFRLIAAGWIFWLAWRLFRASRQRRADGPDRPFTFLEAVLFQWVNPKLWAVAVAASAFVAELGPVAAGGTLALAFSGLNIGVCLFWASAGHLLRRLLSDERLWRAFMTVMAAMMAGSAMLVFA